MTPGVHFLSLFIPLKAGVITKKSLATASRFTRLQEDNYTNAPKNAPLQSLIISHLNNLN